MPWGLAPEGMVTGQIDTCMSAQACRELQTVWAIESSTVNCAEILKSIIMQVSWKQNLVPNMQKIMRDNVCSVASTNNNLKFIIWQRHSCAMMNNT